MRRTGPAPTSGGHVHPPRRGAVRSATSGARGDAMPKAVRDETFRDMTVRDEQPADRAAVRRVIEAAFARADEADLVERLRADGDSVLSLVAVGDDGIVGHVMFSRMTAPFRALALAPVAVAPARQRAGTGSLLIRAALGRLRADATGAAIDGAPDGAMVGEWDGVFVLGEPRYYARFGFDPGLARGFASPYAGPHLMALSLQA